MGFWVFMMVMNLLIPFIMIVFGKVFIKNAPKEINWAYGYRSSMSMKNKETWQFAHHYCGRLWTYIGYVSLVLTALSMLFVLGKDTDTVGIFGGVVSGVQIVILLLSIVPTELALRRNFDKNGEWKKEVK